MTPTSSPMPSPRSFPLITLWTLALLLPTLIGIWASVATRPAVEAWLVGDWLGLGVFALMGSGVGLGAALVRRLHREALGLREEQHLLRTVIEGTSDPVFLKDISGRYLLANSAFGQVLGRPVEDVLGRDDSELFPPDTAREYKEADQQVIAAGEPRAFESTTRREGKDWIFLTSKTPFRDSAGRVQGVIGISRDITARKEAEEALRRTRDELEQAVRERTVALASANAILKAVFDGTTDAIYVKDLEGRYLLANAAAARAIGKRPEDMLGHNDAELFAPEDARAIDEQDRAVMRTGEARTFEQQLQIGEGTRYYLSTKGPYRDSAGRVVGLIGISRDITDRKREEEALRQSQKLESLGLLAGGIAHDFNNLLVALLGQSSLAQSKLASDHPARENLEKAIKAAERAADLTRQMLDYSGRGHLQVRPVQLNGVVEENLHLLRVAVPKQVRLVSQLAADLPPVDADVGQLQQVVMNLITNAAEAIGDREGTVVVGTGTRPVRADEAHLWRHTGEPLSPGRYVWLEVRDDGRGMDAATLDRIFDPFFTTKFTGRGLGLARPVRGERGRAGDGLPPAAPRERQGSGGAPAGARGGAPPGDRARDRRRGGGARGDCRRVRFPGRALPARGGRRPGPAHLPRPRTGDQPRDPRPLDAGAERRGHVPGAAEAAPGSAGPSLLRLRRGAGQIPIRGGRPRGLPAEALSAEHPARGSGAVPEAAVMA